MSEAPREGLEVPLWRAIAVFRIVALGYAALLILANHPDYARPAAGLAVLVGMICWTAYAIHAYAAPARRRLPLLCADLAVAIGALLATAWVERPRRIAEGTPTLPMAWVAGAVLAWAVWGGKRQGMLAAALVGLAGITVHGVAGDGLRPSHSTYNGIVLVFVAGVVVGHVAKLVLRAEAQLARAIELAAATRERERLARSIHDSVLQVLTLVQRRGSELGGEAAELGRQAGEQEAALRALIGSGATLPRVEGRGGPRGEPGGNGGVTDLRALLAPRACTAVTLSAPATPVWLAAGTAREIDAAVGAALDNVRNHCGAQARAWVLLEEGGGTVTVSVRDDGPGMAAGRLREAAAAGRLGIVQSIQGRIRDLGGTVSISSVPGEGTEIEMSVPVPAA